MIVTYITQNEMFALKIGMRVKNNNNKEEEEERGGERKVESR